MPYRPCGRPGLAQAASSALVGMLRGPADCPELMVGGVSGVSGAGRHCPRAAHRRARPRRRTNPGSGRAAPEGPEPARWARRDAILYSERQGSPESRLVCGELLGFKLNVLFGSFAASAATAVRQLPCWAARRPRHTGARRAHAPKALVGGVER